MRIRCAIAVLVLLVSVAYFCCVVQGHGQALTPLRPFVISPGTSQASTNPESILPFGIKYWWKATDLSNSPVAVWTDRIKGYTFSQSNTNWQPGWDATNGVKFNPSVYTNLLQSTNYIQIAASTEPWVVIFQYHNVSQTERPLLEEDQSSTQKLIGICNAGYLYGQDPVIGGCSWLPWGTFRCAMVSAPKSWQKHWNLTNNVSCLSEDSQMNTTAGNLDMGAKNYGNGTWSPSYVDVMEIIVWTNTLAGASQTNYWDSTTVSNVYWYATNTWWKDTNTWPH